jgi:hypothetical protein
VAREVHELDARAHVRHPVHLLVVLPLTVEYVLAGLVAAVVAGAGLRVDRLRRRCSTTCTKAALVAPDAWPLVDAALATGMGSCAYSYGQDECATPRTPSARMASIEATIGVLRRLCAGGLGALCRRGGSVAVHRDGLPARTRVRRHACDRRSCPRGDGRKVAPECARRLPQVEISLGRALQSIGRGGAPALRGCADQQRSVLFQEHRRGEPSLAVDLEHVRPVPGSLSRGAGTSWLRVTCSCHATRTTAEPHLRTLDASIFTYCLP